MAKVGELYNKANKYLKRNGMGKTAIAVGTLHHGHILAVGDVERVLGGIGRLGETKQIDSVQDVGLALAVEAHEAIELGCKLKRSLADIAIVEDI